MSYQGLFYINAPVSPLLYCCGGVSVITTTTCSTPLGRGTLGLPLGGVWRGKQEQNMASDAPCRRAPILILVCMHLLFWSVLAPRFFFPFVSTVHGPDAQYFYCRAAIFGTPLFLFFIFLFRSVRVSLFFCKIYF